MNSLMARSSASFCLPAQRSSRILASDWDGALVGIVVGLAGPDGAFVELDSFVRGAAENHGAHAAVADRQGFDPEVGGLFVPEGEGIAANRGGSRGEEASAATVSFHEKGRPGACPRYRLTLYGYRRQIAAGDDAVDHAISDGLIGLHDVVAVHIFGHAVDGWPVALASIEFRISRMRRISRA